MNKMLAATVAVGTLMGGAAQAEDQVYLEFVVYSVHDEAGFPATRAAAAREIESTADGFLWWKRLKGEGGQFADVVAWESPVAAQTAAKLVESDARFRPLISAIDETVHFGHYWAHARAGTLAQQLDQGPVVEIALYTVKDPIVHADIHAELYTRLAGREGLVGGARMHRDGVENGFGDLLVWRDVASHEATGKAMMEMQELAPFFEGADESIVFALFEKDTAE